MSSRCTLAALLAALIPVVASGQDAGQLPHAHPAEVVTPAATGSHEPREQAQVAADLSAQLQAVRHATSRFRNLDVARDEGYRRFGRAEQPLVGEHWYRRDLVTAPLDLERPSTLMYARVDGEPVLVGVAYTVYRAPDEPLPEGFAGDADVWHVHDVPALVRAITTDRPLLRGAAERRLERAGERTQLTMVHAWVWLDNPEGPFALRHRALPYLKAGLPTAWAEGAGEEAARGISLLEPEACEREVAGLDALVRLSRGQRRSLESACEESAGEVSGASAPRLEASAFNAAAEEAWRRYAALRDASLTPEQRSRLQALVDHATHDGRAEHAP